MPPKYKIVEHRHEWDITFFRPLGTSLSTAITHKIYVIRKLSSREYKRMPSYKISVTRKLDYLPAVRLPKKFDTLLRAWVQMKGAT